MASKTALAFDVFGGLDFSGAKEPLSNLWSAVGIARDGRLLIVDLRPHAFRQDAADWIQGGFQQALPDTFPADCSRLWGLDFPMSLPDQAARAIWPGYAGVWADQVGRIARQLPQDLAAAAESLTQVKRDCDGGSAMAPLNLRIIKQTHEGLRLIEQLRRDAGLVCLPFDDDAGPLTAIEVYPTQTAKDLGLRGRKPGRPGDGSARPAQLLPHLDFAHPSMAAACGALEDAWDAVLACLTAYLVRDDLAQPVVEPQVSDGWIYRHPQAVRRG